MGIFLHQDGFKPPLKQMPHSRMPSVVVLRIAAVQLPHAKREIRLRRFDEGTIVLVPSGSRHGTGHLNVK